MCGIAGALYRRPVTSLDLDQVARMGREIAYRGPDAHAVVQAGPCVLASVRLAIVDVKHGAQPYSNESGRIRVVFNGEIYNHQTLRAGLIQRGYRLRSHSDGEVIAHLYEEYGDACIAMLDGQFAIAIADAGNGTLLLAQRPQRDLPAALDRDRRRGLLLFRNQGPAGDRRRAARGRTARAAANGVLRHGMRAADRLPRCAGAGARPLPAHRRRDRRATSLLDLAVPP
ncbi:hypothetical protein LP419_38730 [Massilia sp. H-1]|nr:hypothetical protein LP419_38730 [Massilia sp. H-1]